MGQYQSQRCNSVEELFGNNNIENYLINVSSINKTIMRYSSPEKFGSEGYPNIGENNQPVWFTDESGISMYKNSGGRTILKNYKFKKNTNYNLINMTNANVMDPNDLILLTDINRNLSYEDRPKMNLNKHLMKYMVDCVIKNLDFDTNGQISTTVRNQEITISKQELTAIYGIRGKNTLVEVYLFIKLFEELDKYDFLQQYNIIGFYNGVSEQDNRGSYDDAPLPSEIVILQKNVRNCMDVINDDDELNNTRKKRKKMQPNYIQQNYIQQNIPLNIPQNIPNEFVNDATSEYTAINPNKRKRGGKRRQKTKKHIKSKKSKKTIKRKKFFSR